MARLPHRVSRRSALKGAAGVPLAGLAGCLGGSNGITTIRFAFTTPHNELAGTLFESDYVVDNVLEYYGEEYETEMSNVAGSPVAVSSVGANDAQIGGFAFSSAATAAQEEAIPAGFSILAGSMWQGVGDYFSQTAASAADSGIEEVEDLEGNELAVNTRGAGSDLNARKVLSDHGLEYEEDVALQEIGFGAMPDAILQGRTDAAVLTQPFWYQNEDDLNFLFDGGDAQDNQPFVMWGARNDFLEENGEAVEYLLEDYWTALQWWFGEDDRDQVLDVAVDVAGYDNRDVADAFVGTENDFYKGQNGIAIEADDLQASWDMMQELGFLEADLDASEYVDNSYIPENARDPPA